MSAPPVPLTIRLTIRCGLDSSTTWVSTFLISLHLTLGEEATSPALRELYLRSEHYGDRSTEEQIYRTFLKHTPSGLEEEFRDLYRRLHGGPFIDAED